MDDEFIDQDFLQTVNASKDIVKKRQDARVPKEGEVSLSGTLESYVSTYIENGQKHNINTPTPPNPEMKDTRDGKKKYPAAMPMNVRVTNLDLIPNEVIKRDDGKEGWKVRADVTYFESASKYLRKNTAIIWSAKATDEQKRMREYVDQESGELVTTKWLLVSPNDQVKVKVPESMATVFREDNPKRPGLKRVQPSTPIKFARVVAEVFVDIKDREVETDDATATVTAAAVVTAQEGQAHDAADLAAAASEQGEADSVPAVGGKRKIKVVLSYPSYSCKGGVVINEDYDADLARTERLHDLRDPNAHNMVPIEDLRSKKVLPPRSAYFYVKKTRMTPWSPESDPAMKGVSVARSTDIDPTDYMTIFMEKKKPRIIVRFNLAQWHAGDQIKSKRNRYVVKIIGSGDEHWRNFGITQLDSYALIVGANPELPLHIDATLWEQPTLKIDSNRPELINNKEELKDIRGYYVYGAEDIVPDFLRFFRTNGTKLSPDYVAKEFSYWESVNKATKKTVVRLEPVDATKRNPVNIGDLQATVLALGNGWYPEANDPNPSVGVNHAYKGDIAPLFDGGHDFYVLTSYVMSADERIQWTRPDSPFADSFLEGLKKRHVHYWIYAVRKDAAMSKNFAKAKVAEQTPVTAKAVPAAPAPAAETKRERSVSVSASASEVSESEGGEDRPKRTRAKRTTAK